MSSRFNMDDFNRDDDELFADEFSGDDAPMQTFTPVDESWKPMTIQPAGANATPSRLIERVRDRMGERLRENLDKLNPLFGKTASGSPAVLRSSAPHPLMANSKSSPLANRTQSTIHATMPTNPVPGNSPPLVPPPSPPSPPASSPFGGGLFGKLGNNRFEFVPIEDAVVRFDLLPLMRAFAELVGVRQSGPGDTVEPVARALEADRERVKALREDLDAAWAGYDLRGAAFVFNWIEDVKSGLVARANALSQPPQVYIAADLPLVLNVLGRARGTLLLARAPLALERAFLTRTLATSDPRLVELALSAPAKATVETVKLPESKNEKKERG